MKTNRRGLIGVLIASMAWLLPGKRTQAQTAWKVDPGDIVRLHTDGESMRGHVLSVSRASTEIPYERGRALGITAAMLDASYANKHLPFNTWVHAAPDKKVEGQWEITEYLERHSVKDGSLISPYSSPAALSEYLRHEE